MHEQRTSAREQKTEDVSPVEARQGSGPSDMFVVLVVSLLLAAAAGTALLAYFLS